MWIATRSAVRPRDDENAAMAYQKSSRCQTREEARKALEAMIVKEISGWREMGMSAARDESALEILRNTDLDKIEVDGVRWRVYEF